MIIATLSNNVNSHCNDNSNKGKQSPALLRFLITLIHHSLHSLSISTPTTISIPFSYQASLSTHPIHSPFTIFPHTHHHNPATQTPTINRTPYRITAISRISLQTLPSHTPITPQLSHHAITSNPSSNQFHKPSSNSYPQSLSTIRSRGQPFIPFQYSRIVTICHHE